MSLFNVKTKTLIIISVITSLICVLAVVLYLYSIINQTVFTFMFLIALIATSSCVSMILNKYFSKRLNEKSRGKKYLVEDLKLDGVEFENLNYGKVAIKVEKNILYNLTIVTDPKIFFSDYKDELANRVNSSCVSKTVEIYIFDNKSGSDYRQTTILNYQGKNFYVASFIYIKKDSMIIHTDKIEPNEDFIKPFNELLNLINAKEVD